MSEIIRSTNSKQEEIINDILKLHSKNGYIDVDVTYSKGVFYKSGVVEQPRLKFDLQPQTDDTVKCSSDNLSLVDNSVNTIMFDPPFVISGKTYANNQEGSSKIAKRFGAYHSFEELKTHYYYSLKEFYRVLEDDGIVIFKCQNTISSGKQHMSHYFIIKSALELGYYIKDEFLLTTNKKITSFGGRWKTQQHAAKYHSFFLVLQKKKNNVNYDI